MVPLPSPRQVDRTGAAADAVAATDAPPRPRLSLAGIADRLSFRSLIYLGVFVSGLVALTFQVVWQRYLAFLVGSEARSISLVIAIFLLGLASGYQFWGKLTERGWSRQAVLKTVGYVELAIAAYGLLFPTLFWAVRDLAILLPDSLAADILIAALLLFLPTFLMGASIPLLTSAVPAHAGEVNVCHFRIYGLNTLGAFVGAFLAGFFLLPNYGLPMSLIIAVIANIFVGLVFIANTLEGPSHKAQEPPRIVNTFGSAGVYLFVFVTGSVSIASEVLFIRLLGLSIGSGHFVFPIVVGIVILGLAIGALTLPRRGVTSGRVFVELVKVIVMLAVIYFIVPFWPYWLSNVRVSLTNLPSNYTVFVVVVVLFTALMVLPVVIPMGRLLPMGYALIEKSRSDYGKICGRVYFTNTLGTVFGAVGLGYAMFAVLDLPSLFKLNIALLAALAAFLAFRSVMLHTGALLACVAILAFFLPTWNRQTHYIGLFRETIARDYHFRGLFSLPDHARYKVIFARDDPNATVGAFLVPINEMEGLAERDSRTIAVNGKADGNTVADYSNMVLAGLLPYFFCEADANLTAAVIGLGTGLTSGALARAEDIRSVITLEISPAVIGALPHFDPDNFQLAANPKSQIVQTDAFRFFARRNEKFDIIVAEPSNPWVVGVENLFTPEFYQLASKSMHKHGVLCQWIQRYEINEDIFAAIVRNVLEEFEYASLFHIGEFDVGIVASHAPLERPHLRKRMTERGLQAILRPMGLDTSDHEAADQSNAAEALIDIVEWMPLQHLHTIAATFDVPVHRLEFPWLGHAAGRARFLQQTVRPMSMVPAIAARHLAPDTQKMQRIAQWRSAHRDFSRWCAPVPGMHSTRFICQRLEALQDFTPGQIVQDVASANLALSSYRVQRDGGMIGPDSQFLASVDAVLMQDGSDVSSQQVQELAAALATEYALEWQWDAVRDFLARMHARGVMDRQAREVLERQVQELRQRSDEWRDWMIRWEKARHER